MGDKEALCALSWAIIRLPLGTGAFMTIEVIPLKYAKIQRPDRNFWATLDSQREENIYLPTILNEYEIGPNFSKLLSCDKTRAKYSMMNKPKSSER